MEQSEQKAVFDLIRRAMPKVAQVVAEKRKALGNAHVTECQRRGMAGEPGWFFARENGIAIGTPWDNITDVWADTSRATQVLVFMRDPAPGGGSGAH